MEQKNPSFLPVERTSQEEAEQRTEGDFSSLIKSAINLRIFCDERDRILALFNEIQASFGFGEAFYAQSGNSVEISTDNPYCLFKSIAYERLSVYDSSEGLIYFVVDKDIGALRGSNPPFMENLRQRIVKDPNVRIMMDSMEGIDENRSKVAVYVYRTDADGREKRFSTEELKAAFAQSEVQIVLKSLGIVKTEGAADFNQNRTEELLEQPPPGMSNGLWEAAKLENPDPEKYFPVQVLGFDGLDQRVRYLLDELAEQQERLRELSSAIKTLEERAVQLQRISGELLRHQERMEDRVFKVLSVFAVVENRGQSICSEEEGLKNSMEVMLDKIEHMSKDTLFHLEENILKLRERELFLTNERKNALKNQTKQMELLADKLKKDLRKIGKLGGFFRKMERMRQFASGSASTSCPNVIEDARAGLPEEAEKRE